VSADPFIALLDADIRPLDYCADTE
jgi:hypothetical protein